MLIRFHKRFKKKYVKYQIKLRKHIDTRLQIFIKNPFDPILENHQLHGRFNEKSSININGNIRAIYSISKDGSVQFLYIGTHSELYE